MTRTTDSPHDAGEGTDLDRLPDRLRASALDRPPGERAAIAVLVVHGQWLRHDGFLLSCVRSFRDQWWINWRIVRRFLARTPCSELSHEVLLLAAELAQWETGRRIQESTVFGGFDEGTYRRLTEAVGPDLVDRRPNYGRR